MAKKKKILSLFTILVISVSVGSVVPIYGNTDTNLTINYVPIMRGAKPIIKNGSTLVPIRIISETLGADVQWNEKTKSIKINKGGTNIDMTIGNPKVKLNGVSQSIQTAPILYNGATMLPIRFVGEALNSTVEWDSKTRTVYVTSNEGIKVEKPNFDKDYWGREVRTTNLPKNASLFPYIAKDVPNWVYEKINMKAPALLSLGAVDMLPKELYNSEYDLERAVKVLENHFEHAINIDYRTINKEEYRKYVKESFYLKVFKDGGYTSDELADSFVDHIIKNKIIVKGTAVVLPEMMWQSSMGNRVANAWVTIEVQQQGTSTDGFRDLGGSPKNSSLTGKYPVLVTGDKYQGLVQFRMIGYEIDYNTNCITSQVSPESNVFGGAYTGK